MDSLEFTSEMLKFPPTKSKSGKIRFPYDQIEVVAVASNLVSKPVIFTSDLHQHAQNAFWGLEEMVDLNKYFVVSCGDMAGNEYYGSNADPIELYEYILDKSKGFFFVQGNHDLPNPDEKEFKLTNNDGTKCMIQDGKAIQTPFGRIGGVNGIISSRFRGYSQVKETYLQNVEKAFRGAKLDIFSTHETPKLPLDGHYIGRTDLYDIIKKKKPKIHVYGHCHHPKFHNYINGTNFLNADSRILIFNLPIDD